MHSIVGGDIGLEVEGDLPGHPGQDGQQVPGVRLSLDHVTQGLDEPTALGSVPPTVEARDGATTKSLLSS